MDAELEFFAREVAAKGQAAIYEAARGIAHEQDFHTGVTARIITRAIELVAEEALQGASR